MPPNFGCGLRLGFRSADSDNRDPCSQIAVVGHAENSSGVFLRFFLSTEPPGRPKNELCWKEFDPVIRHVVVLSVAFEGTP